jgi:cytoskeleton protein RodZ
MTIGKQLRQARESRSLSLEQVSQATHIRVRYLQALEAEQFDLLPSTAHVRGFLRAYAAQLKLDPAPLLAGLSGEAAPQPPLPDLLPIEPAVPSADSSEGIFAEIGDRLRGQRELLGLSLEDVERHTHIRMHYVRALETGSLAGLPSPVQGKGMLNNYAAFLGLDTDALLLRFADGLQAGLAARQPERSASRPVEKPSRPARPSALRRLLSPDFLIGGVIVIFLIAFAIWGTLRVSALRAAEQAVPTPASISDVLLETPAAELAATPTLAQGSLTPSLETPADVTPEQTLDATLVSSGVTTTPDFGAAAVQVYLVVQQRTWMRVTVDGEVAFEGRVLPGSAYPFAGDERIELVTGNGAGLQVFFNQQDLGLLGLFGEIVQRVFTVQGVLLPTPAVPPTSTPAPTATPTPPGTPGATSTPTP